MTFDPKTAPPIDFMRYQKRTQEAMREVMRASLALVARDGLIGNHHLHLTFGTCAHGVEVSQRLRDCTARIAADPRPAAGEPTSW